MYCHDRPTPHWLYRFNKGQGVLSLDHGVCCGTRGNPWIGNRTCGAKNALISAMPQAELGCQAPERFDCFALRDSRTQSHNEGLKRHSSGNVASSKLVRTGENSTHVLPQSVQLGVELGLQVGQVKASALCEIQAHEGARGDALNLSASWCATKSGVCVVVLMLLLFT